MRKVNTESHPTFEQSQTQLRQDNETAYGPWLADPVGHPTGQLNTGSACRHGRRHSCLESESRAVGIPASAVNFFITPHCNMTCRFCFARFRDRPTLGWTDASRLLELLAGAGCRKLTFVGGEPFLSPWLMEAVTLAKRLSMTTCVITNGALATPAWVERVAPVLDWLGLSIDSVDPNTNRRIGRAVQGTPLPWGHYESLGEAAHRTGVRLKVNTVVCSWNWRQDFSKHIPALRPARWKVFQALPVAGQNDHQGDTFVVSDDQFADFRSRHENCPNTVFETNEAMRDSYLMISPDGRFFDNGTGKYRYSRCILDHGVDVAAGDIRFDSAKFSHRGGDYAWEREGESGKDAQ